MSTNPKDQGLEIEIGRCSCCKKQEIRVLHSPFDRPRAPLKLPDKRRKAIGRKVESFAGLLLKGAEHERARRELAQEIGSDLFDLLFPEPLRTTFEKSVAASRKKDGLRLRLSFGTPYDHHLGGLPWELLYDPSRQRFIGSEQQTPVVRYLDFPDRIDPLDVEPPLKVLGVVASPDPATSERYDYHRIDVERHRDALDSVLDPLGHLEIQHTENGTLDALHQTLMGADDEGAPFHAVHLLCHGGFDGGEGVLFMETADGGERMVSGADLAQQLTPSDIRLVVLASCQTAKSPIPPQDGQSALAGVAAALVAKGISAVVAMQFNVSENAALAFTKAFYQAIEKNKAIDDAVNEGRLAIDRHGDRGDLERATPVLFLRAADGRVLNLRLDLTPPKKVAIFNVLHHGKEAMAHAQIKADLRRYFDGRFIKDRMLWNGKVLTRLRNKLGKLPDNAPYRVEMAAPLSVAFATGFLLPAKMRSTVTLTQRDQKWSFSGDKPPHAPSWKLNEVPEQKARDIAVVVEIAHPCLDAVNAFLRGETPKAPPVPPPKVERVIVARLPDPDQSGVVDGGHARYLAQKLVHHIKRHTHPNTTVHFFLDGPQGLAFMLGRQWHGSRTAQLYEYDFNGERHGSYEPSFTLVPTPMGTGS